MSIAGIKRGAVKGSFEVDLMDLCLEYLLFTMCLLLPEDTIKCVLNVCLACV